MSKGHRRDGGMAELVLHSRRLDNKSWFGPTYTPPPLKGVGPRRTAKRHEAHKRGHQFQVFRKYGNVCVCVKPTVGASARPSQKVWGKPGRKEQLEENMLPRNDPEQHIIWKDRFLIFILVSIHYFSVFVNSSIFFA